MTISLRRAVQSDGYGLWLWANDPAVRVASGDRALISWAEHLVWLEGRLDSSDAMILIGVAAGGRPVGTVRFETGDRWGTARVSYLVAAEARGGGVGRLLLDHGLAKLTEAHPGARAEALVRPANGASCHLFRSGGWTEAGSNGKLIQFLAPGRVP